MQLYTDASCRIHIYRTGVGGVLIQDGLEVDTFSRSMSFVESDVGEYMAIFNGLLLARRNMQFELTEIHCDNLNIVGQLNGTSAVRGKVIPYYEMVVDMIARMHKPKICYCARTNNRRAHQLAGLAVGIKQSIRPSVPNDLLKVSIFDRMAWG